MPEYIHILIYGADDVAGMYRLLKKYEQKFATLLEEYGTGDALSFLESRGKRITGPWQYWMDLTGRDD
jgi:hypothetical protein